MTKNRLDTVETFDHFGHDHWKALGTKLGGVEIVKQILRGTVQVTTERIRCLSSLTNFSLLASERDVKHFFQIREGLWVSEAFKNCIVNEARTGLLRTGNMNLSYADVVDASAGENGTDIDVELPEGYVFIDVDIFLVAIAKLIEKQLLDKSGCANRFYVEIRGRVSEVDVRWMDLNSEWSCGAWHSRRNRVNVGDRVYSATGS